MTKLAAGNSVSNQVRLRMGMNPFLRSKSSANYCKNICTLPKEHRENESPRFVFVIA